MEKSSPIYGRKRNFSSNDTSIQSKLWLERTFDLLFEKRRTETGNEDNHCLFCLPPFFNLVNFTAAVGHVCYILHKENGTKCQKLVVLLKMSIKHLAYLQCCHGCKILQKLAKSSANMRHHVET